MNTHKSKGAGWRTPIALLAVPFLLMVMALGACDLLGAGEPDPAAVQQLDEARAKYEATVNEMLALQAAVKADGVTPELIERLAAQVASVAEANKDVQEALEKLKQQEDAGGDPTWLNLLKIIGGYLGLDWTLRGRPSKGLAGAVLNKTGLQRTKPPRT